MPFIMILGAVGFMFGAGGSALVSKTLGEGDDEKAKRSFSMLICVSFLLGTVISVLGIIFVRPVASMLGAENEMLDYCVMYARIVLIALPFFMMQQEFQSFFITAEKPKLGLISTVIAGVTNMILDALFMAVLGFGVKGAAAATAISQTVGGVFPLIYFSRNNGSLLKLTKFRFDGKALFKTVTNGSSELMSSVSMSFVGMLYNVQLLRYIGEDGVSAYGVLMYVCFIFISVFIGYSIGTAPIIGYHFGAGDHAELKNLLKKSLVTIGSFSLFMFTMCILLSGTLSELYVGYDEKLLALTRRGFSFVSFSFLFAGIAIFGSNFFTALSNGPVSAAISFLRTLVFESAFVMLLPLVFKSDGIWLSTVAADLMAAIVTAIFIVCKRKKYHYW